jgi:hypothetical protein
MPIGSTTECEARLALELRDGETIAACAYVVTYDPAGYMKSYGALLVAGLPVVWLASRIESKEWLAFVLIAVSVGGLALFRRLFEVRADYIIGVVGEEFVLLSDLGVVGSLERYSLRDVSGVRLNMEALQFRLPGRTLSLTLPSYSGNPQEAERVMELTRV